MESDSIGVAPRRLPFTLIENVVLEDPELWPVDVLVYLALAKHADAAGTCWPSLATIGKIARCGRTAALASIAHLEARGYLKRSPRFRPDGGVTSNFYQLLTVKVEAPAPVRQAEAPRPHRAPAPVHHVDTNYIQSEQDSKKRREEPAQRQAGCPAAPVSVPLSSLLGRIKAEAKSRGAPMVVGRDFTSGIGELTAAGIPEAELVAAFITCIDQAPERVTFFPRDFLRWRKVSREREEEDRERRQAEAGRAKREEDRRQAEEQRERLRSEPRAELDFAAAWRKIAGQ